MSLPASDLQEYVCLHMIGAIIHMTTTSPPTTLAAAHHGVSSGEPIYAIWAQSNVMGKRPNPETTPNCFYVRAVAMEASSEMHLRDSRQRHSLVQTM